MKKLITFIFAIALTMAIPWNAWGDVETFSATEMVANSNAGTTKSGITVSSVSNLSTSNYQCGATSANTDKSDGISYSTNGSYYVDIRTATGYISEVKLEITESGTNGNRVFAYVAWDGTDVDAEYVELGSKVMPKKGENTCGTYTATITPPTGTKCIRLYRQVYTKDNKVTSSSSNVTKTPSSNASSAYLFNVEVTTAGTTPVTVTSLSLSESTLTLVEGNEATLQANVLPATNNGVDWSSDNENVAKVVNGKVTAIAAGTCTITATTKDKNADDEQLTATCAVTVNPSPCTDTKGTTLATTIAGCAVSTNNENDKGVKGEANDYKFANSNYYLQLQAPAGKYFVSVTVNVKQGTDASFAYGFSDDEANFTYSAQASSGTATDYELIPATGTLPTFFRMARIMGSVGNSTSALLYKVCVELADIPTFAVTYSPNGAGGTAITNNVSRVEDNMFTAPDGMQFKEWRTDVDDETTAVAVGTKVTGDITLYAIWETKVATYTLTYNANGGTGTMEIVNGVNVTVADCDFTAPEGYQFKEWRTDVADETTVKAVGAGLTLTADITLYAIWENKPLSDKKQLIRAKLSNGFDCFVKESDHTVMGYYIAGTDAPTLVAESLKTLDNEGVATINTDGTITVTAEDGTTQDYTVTTAAVTPYTTKGEIEFDGTETWIKTGLGTAAWNSTKHWVTNKSLDEPTASPANMRVAEGKNRINFFVGACESITLTISSGTTSNRTIAVYRNGKDASELGVEFPTNAPGGKADGSATITIPCDPETPSYITIVNTKGSGGGDLGFMKMSLTPVITPHYITGQALCGSWEPDALLLEGNTHTFTNVAPGLIEFKITDGQWNQTEDPTHEWGYDKLADNTNFVNTGGNGNVKFINPIAQDITVSFDEETQLITVTPADQAICNTLYYVSGNGQDRGLWCNGKDWGADNAENILLCGSITFKNVPAGDKYQFQITNGTWESKWGYNNLSDNTNLWTEDDGNNVFFYLSVPSDVTIAFDGSNITVTITEAVVDYYIAGNGDEFADNVWLRGKKWEGTDADNKLDATDGISFTLPATTTTPYEFKITDGMNWYGYTALNEAIKANFVNTGDDGNVKFITTAEQTITVKFDQATKTIDVTSNVVNAITGDMSAIVITDYTLVGAAELFGTADDIEDENGKNKMILVEGETAKWELSKTNIELAAGIYNYKVVGNHSYSVYELPGANQNNTLTIDADGIYTITFTLDRSGAEDELTAETTPVAVGTKYYLIGTDSELTGHFNTNTAITKPDNAAAYYALASGAGSSWTTMSGYADNTKFFSYDTKTDVTTLVVDVYNSNSSNKKLYYSVVAEDGTITLTEGNEEITSKKSARKIIPVTGRATVYFLVESTNVQFTQVTAYENGANAIQTVSAGYELNLNKGRLAAKSGKAVKMDGIEFYLSGDYQARSSEYAKLSTNKTHYIKFTLENPTQLKVTLKNTNSSRGIYVADSREGTTNQIVLSAGEYAVNLKAGTWYINPYGGEVQITNIAFSAYEASTDATLKTLKYGTEEITLEEDVYTYAVELPYGTTEIPAVTAEANSTVAKSVVITNATALPGSATVVVTAEDGTTTQTYTINFTVNTNVQYTVTFDSKGGSAVAPVQVNNGETVSQPADPTRELYGFDGWYTDEDYTTAVDFNAAISDDVTYYAKWNEVYATSIDFVAEANGDKTAIKTFLNAHGIAYSENIATNGAWDDGSGHNGDDWIYAGYKMKDKGAYITFRVHADDYVRITMGYVENAAALTIDGTAVEYTTSTTAITWYEFTPTTDVVVKLAYANTNDKKTTAIRSIQIGGDKNLNVVGNQSITTDDTYASVTVQPNGKLTVNDALTVTGDLVLQAAEGKKPEMLLNAGVTVNGDVYYEWAIQTDKNYVFALPFEVAWGAIEYWNENKTGGADWDDNFNLYITEYDSQSRADNGVHEGAGETTNWKYSSASTPLQANKGYVLNVPAANVGNAGQVTLRFKLAENATLAAMAGTSIATAEYASENEEDAGWNFLGNPYFETYKAELSGVRYTTVPNLNGDEDGYQQGPSSSIPLKPFTPFFVQVESTGSITFAVATRSAMPALYAAENDELFAELTLGNDHAGILMSDRYTTTYEINADLYKMMGDAQTTAIYTVQGATRLAYNALPDAAAQAIPVGFSVPAAGEYTIDLADGYSEGFEHLFLTDKATNSVTDLLSSAYTFTTTGAEVCNEARFELNAVRRVTEEVTGIEAGTLELLNAGTHKLLLDGKVYIVREGVWYDVMGKRVSEK